MVFDYLKIIRYKFNFVKVACLTNIIIENIFPTKISHPTVLATLFLVKVRQNFAHSFLNCVFSD